MKMRSRVFLLTLLVIVICGVSRESAASTCVTPSACEAFNRAKAVFIGRAIHTSQKQEYVYEGETYVSCSSEVVFEVIEPFFGVTGRLMSVWESEGGMCTGRSFTLGETSLVYADEGEDKKLWAYGCGRTRSLQPFQPVSVSASNEQWSQEYQCGLQKEYDEELEFLRGVVRKSLSGARIYGEAHLSQSPLGKNDKGRGTSLADVTIRIESDRQSLEAKTGSDGKFDIQGLEPGIYKVTALPPAGYVLAYSSRNWNREFSLRDCGCSQGRVTLDPTFQVNGRVLDTEGTPLAEVEVSLISEEWQVEEIKDGVIKSFQTRSGKTDTDGKYKIEKVAPGRYLLGVNVTRPTPQSPYPRIVYPDVSDIKRAEVIIVELGKTAGPFDLRLTRKLETHTIQGSVVWPDDTPAVGAIVELRHPDDLLRRRNGATTDEQGRFTLKGLKDYEYEIKVYWRDDEKVSDEINKSPLGWRSATSEVEKLKVTGDVKDLKIILSKQGQ